MEHKRTLRFHSGGPESERAAKDTRSDPRVYMPSLTWSYVTHPLFSAP